jgi:hypothetical protein
MRELVMAGEHNSCVVEGKLLLLYYTWCHVNAAYH